MSRLALALCLLLAPLASYAREWYVAPDGSAQGDGTEERPWSLDAAIRPHPMIAPMDTIWVRKGIYNGSFVSRLKGLPGKPVVLRAFPGERVILDGHGYSPKPVLTIEGEWAWYWGLEITNSDPRRTVGTAGSNAPEDRGTGIVQAGPNTKIINCIVHDVGVGIGQSKNVPDTEIYGTVIFNNGWRTPDRSHGHSIYSQNVQGEKWIRETILFNPFSFNMHIYGSRSAALDHFRLEGNVGFNGRWLVGGEAPVRDLVMRENMLYSHGAQLSYRSRANEDLVLENNYLPVPVSAGHGWNRMTARGNTFMRPRSSGALVELVISEGNDLKSSVFEGNTYVVGHASQAVASVLAPASTAPKLYSFTDWKAEGFEKEGRLEVVEGGIPNEPKIFVRRNFYEPNRAHVIIYNWPRQDVVYVDISVLNPKNGDRWVLRNVQNYFEELISGTYENKPIPVPMTGWTAAAPVGEEKPLYPATFPEFGVFVLTLESGSSLKTALAADSSLEGVGAPGALLETSLPPRFYEGPAIAGVDPFGEELAGVRVHVTDADGEPRWARIVYVDSTRVVWEAPVEMALGPARVRIVREGLPETDAGWLCVERAAPALFRTWIGNNQAAMGWVRYRDGTVTALVRCGGGDCEVEPVDPGSVAEIGLLGSGFGRSSRVRVKMDDKEVNALAVERADYPGVDWIRIHGLQPMEPGWKEVQVSVESKAAKRASLLIR